MVSRGPLGLVPLFGCLWRGFASVALWSRVGCLREAFRGLVSLSLGLPGPPVGVVLCYVMLCYLTSGSVTFLALNNVYGMLKFSFISNRPNLSQPFDL